MSETWAETGSFSVLQTLLRVTSLGPSLLTRLAIKIPLLAIQFFRLRDWTPLKCENRGEEISVISWCK